MAGQKNNEPAYRLFYSFTVPDSFKYEKDSKGGYKDYTNRYGNYLNALFYVPESLVLKMKKEIKSNTGKEFIRDLVKEFLFKNLSEKGIDITDSWENGKETGGKPIRPPYEAWDEMGSEIILIENKTK